MKVAIVHDWLTNMAGSERCVVDFKAVFPDAPIYTSIYCPENLDKELQNIDVRTSFLQDKKDAKAGKHQKLLPYMPAAFESFNLNEYDIVLSSCNSCSKGIVTSPSTMHICYCHTPMRYAWEFYHEYADNPDLSPFKKKYLKYFMNYMRVWDRNAADRVDYFIANSVNVARRIYKHYRRESVVIHPPVRTKLFQISEVDEGYFLIVSRLVGYKNVELAVRAFNECGLPLVIIGDGEERQRLQSIAKDNIKFLGRQPDEVLREYYSKCRAFVFPGEEDFGITLLEAMASGRPAIAFGKGGALESVVEEKTGVFFYENTVDSLIGAVDKFEEMKFDKNEIRQHSMGFDDAVFEEKIKKYVLESYDEFKKLNKWKVL